MRISPTTSSLIPTASSGPVVQRQRLLAYIQKTMVQFHPGLLNTNAQVRQLEERLGLNPSDCGFESRPVQFMKHGSVGTWQTTLASYQGCRGFDSHLSYSHHVLAEQPGVLATLSRWRSGVQIPSGTLFTTHNDAVRNLEKRRSSNLRDFVGSTPTRVNEFICVG